LKSICGWWQRQIGERVPGHDIRHSDISEDDRGRQVRLHYSLLVIVSHGRERDDGLQTLNGHARLFGNLLFLLGSPCSLGSLGWCFFCLFLSLLWFNDFRIGGDRRKHILFGVINDFLVRSDNRFRSFRNLCDQRGNCNYDEPYHNISEGRSNKRSPPGVLWEVGAVEHGRACLGSLRKFGDRERKGKQSDFRRSC